MLRLELTLSKALIKEHQAIGELHTRVYLFHCDSCYIALKALLYIESHHFVNAILYLICFMMLQVPGMD